MSYITNLKCRECGQEYPISPLHVCETCFGPLEVTYDYARIRAAISRSIRVMAARSDAGVGAPVVADTGDARAPTSSATAIARTAVRCLRRGRADNVCASRSTHIGYEG